MVFRFFFFSSRRRHTRCSRDWSSDVCSSDLTEVDLIARQGSLVAFIEVKSRRGTAFGSPLEAVTGAKRRELVKAARGWVDRCGRPSDVDRFDCIAIVDRKVEHLENAFRPGWR